MVVNGASLNQCFEREGGIIDAFSHGIPCTQRLLQTIPINPTFHCIPRNHTTINMDRSSSQDDDYDLNHSSHLEETLNELEEKVKEHEDILKKVVHTIVSFASRQYTDEDTSCETRLQETSRTVLLLRRPPWRL